MSQAMSTGTRPATPGAPGAGTPVGRVDRDACAELAVVRLGARRSSWNIADLRGEAERIVAELDVVADPRVRRELTEDLTARAAGRCVSLLDRIDVPEHVRALTSREVLAIETELVDRLTARGHQPARPARVGPVIARRDLDHAQRLVVAALTGTGTLVVVEGAAGAGKTTTLAAARELLDMHDRRLVVVTPTLKAAHVATEETGADAYSAAWLAYQHGWRWDGDGAWTRPHRPPEGHYYHRPETRPDIRARLYPGDLLLIDEAGMLDQDTTRALLSIADETGARVAFLGDRHQLPAVGRGGVLDHAARAAPENSHLALETLHRFTDPDYADLTLLMRTGQHPGQVFDTLHQHGLIAIHPSDAERHAALTDIATQHAGTGDTADPADGVRIIADTRDQVAALSAAIRDQRLQTGQTSQTNQPGAGRVATSSSGEPIGTGDRVTTRRNDRDLGVANRDRWTVTRIDDNGGVVVRGRLGQRSLPADYVAQHVELDYATTVHGVQGETVDHAHLLLGETTGAAAAYVAMTRGRHTNTAHLVAETLDDARAQWIDAFSRDRADLGPTHAAQTAAEDIDRYGPQPPPRLPRHREISPEPEPRPPRPEPPWTTPGHAASPGISR